jgi:hypothetical protein
LSETRREAGDARPFALEFPLINPDRLPWAVAIALSAFAISGAFKYAFTWSPVPVALFLGAAGSLIACWLVRGGGLRNLLLAVGVILFALLAVDVVLRMLAPPARAELVEDPAFQRTNRGAAKPTIDSYRAYSRRSDNGATVFDVTYTIDRDGWRQTANTVTGGDTYLFFGDSLTFGFGIEDWQTLPVRFADATGRRFNVLNLAYSGYGAHQMLREIETMPFAGLITGSTRRAFFLTILDHTARVAALRPWGRRGPRYVLDEHGEPQFRGQQLDYRLSRILTRLDDNGGLPRLVFHTLVAIIYPESYRIELTSALVAKSAELLRARLGVELIVLIWDDEDIATYEASLRRRGLRTYRLSEAIGDLDDPAMRIMKGIEDHPSPAADAKIAAWLADMERRGWKE